MSKTEGQAAYERWKASRDLLGVGAEDWEGLTCEDRVSWEAVPLPAPGNRQAPPAEVTPEEIEQQAAMLFALAETVRRGQLTARTARVTGFLFTLTEAGRQHVEAQPG